MEPDLTLEEIQRRLLAERQQKAGIGSIWRFFDRHGISFKRAFERLSRIGLTSRRRERHGGQSTQARSRSTGLIDGTGTSTKMARLRAGAANG